MEPFVCEGRSANAGEQVDEPHDVVLTQPFELLEGSALELSALTEADHGAHQRSSSEHCRPPSWVTELSTS